VRQSERQSRSTDDFFVRVKTVVFQTQGCTGENEIPKFDHVIGRVIDFWDYRRKE